MPYELRLQGRSPATYESENQAIAAAREAIIADPNAEPEITDLTTGKPAAPAASKSWREHFRTQIG